MGKPFGKVVNTKCNVGANRNQAFIEFVSGTNIEVRIKEIFESLPCLLRHNAAQVAVTAF